MAPSHESQFLGKRVEAGFHGTHGTPNCGHNTTSGKDEGRYFGPLDGPGPPGRGTNRGGGDGGKGGHLLRESPYKPIFDPEGPPVKVDPPKGKSRIGPNLEPAGLPAAIQTLVTVPQPSSPTTSSTDNGWPLANSAPTITPAVRAAISGRNVDDAGKGSTSVDITTTFVTTGVFTTDTTQTLPNGSTRVVTPLRWGTRTITTTTKVATHIGTVSSNTGPPKSIIGGVTGAAVIVMILAIVGFCIFRRKRRHPWQADTMPQASTLIDPFYDISTVQAGLPTKIKPGERVPPPEPAHPFNHEPGTASEPLQDPSRDLENTSGPNPSKPRIQETRNALANIQELTVQLETELRGLSTLARSGQLSDSDSARVEVRRIAGLTMPTNFRPGWISSASAGTTYTSPPPSYTDE